VQLSEQDLIRMRTSICELIQPQDVLIIMNAASFLY